MRTPLTYYGGKQLLAPQIVALMPAHRVYLEPFAGGAAVLFAKPRVARETLNDADGQIVRFWRALRERPDELASAVAATPYSRAEWEKCRFGPDRRTGWRAPCGPGDVDDDVEAARRLLVDIDQSFSRSRHGWSPPSILMDRRGRWQPGVWANLPDKLLAATQRLRGVGLERRDALELIPRWDQPDAVIYCDPPYTGDHRLAPDKMYAAGEEPDLWSRLVDVLGAIRHAAVILSGYPCPEAESLGWRSVEFARKRTVQARAGSTLGVAPEVAWLSPAVPEPIPDLLSEVAP